MSSTRNTKKKKKNKHESSISQASKIKIFREKKGRPKTYVTGGRKECVVAVIQCTINHSSGEKEQHFDLMYFKNSKQRWLKYTNKKELSQAEEAWDLQKSKILIVYKKEIFLDKKDSCPNLNINDIKVSDPVNLKSSSAATSYISKQNQALKNVIKENRRACTLVNGVYKTIKNPDGTYFDASIRSGLDLSDAKAQAKIQFPSLAGISDENIRIVSRGYIHRNKYKSQKRKNITSNNESRITLNNNLIDDDVPFVDIIGNVENNTLNNTNNNVMNNYIDTDFNSNVAVLVTENKYFTLINDKFGFPMIDLEDGYPEARKRVKRLHPTLSDQEITTYQEALKRNLIKKEKNEIQFDEFSDDLCDSEESYPSNNNTNVVVQNDLTGSQYLGLIDLNQDVDFNVEALKKVKQRIEENENQIERNEAEMQEDLESDLSSISTKTENLYKINKILSQENIQLSQQEKQLSKKISQNSNSFLNHDTDVPIVTQTYEEILSNLPQIQSQPILRKPSNTNIAIVSNDKNVNVSSFDSDDSSFCDSDDESSNDNQHKRKRNEREDVVDVPPKKQRTNINSMSDINSIDVIKKACNLLGFEMNPDDLTDSRTAALSIHKFAQQNGMDFKNHVTELMKKKISELQNETIFSNANRDHVEKSTQQEKQISEIKNLGEQLIKIGCLQWYSNEIQFGFFPRHDGNEIKQLPKQILSRNTQKN